MDPLFAILTWKSVRYFERCLASIDTGLEKSSSIEGRAAPKIASATKPLVVDYAISAFWLMLCLRGRKSGFRILCVRSAALVHHTEEISRRWRISRSNFSHMRRLAYCS